MDRSKVPAVLSIAGSDSSGGAGIQADIKTITAHRLYAETAITAITAQNTLGVTAVQDISPDIVAAQIDAVFDDIRPNAVKIGMVSSVEIIEVIADRLSACNTHGTGCTLSSAIACALAQGMDLADAVNAGKAYLTGALAAGFDMGKGSGPVNHMWQY